MEAKSDPINFVDSKSESKGDFKSDSKSSSSGGSATTFKADDATANANDAKSIDADGRQWWRVARAGLPSEGGRLHTSINGRFITVFRHAGMQLFNYLLHFTLFFLLLVNNALPLFCYL